MELHEAPEIYERIIHVEPEKGFQVRLTVNSFRGVEYLHVRKYYQDFDETWKPSNEGVAMPLDFSNSTELFKGVAEILSLAETKETIQEYLSDLIKEVYV